MEYLSSFASSLYKFILHFLTGKCQIERLVAKELTSEVVWKIEQNIIQSKVLGLQILKLFLDAKQLEEEICKLKKIQNSPKNLLLCLNLICDFTRLQIEIIKESQIKYDSLNEKHEEKLMLLWFRFSQGQEKEKLESRISKQWKKLGFQGNDPSTDFRGMGILGLDQLVYFTEFYPKELKDLESEQEKETNLPFAILGITITSWLVDLMQSRKLSFYLYSHGVSLKNFNEFYCKMMIRFFPFWENSNPKNLMEFGPVFKRFQQVIEREILPLK